jgi:predicted nucleotidyltransferase
MGSGSRSLKLARPERPSRSRPAAGLGAVALLRDNGMAARLSFDREALAALCRRHRIRRLSLFGSTLKGTNRADSDVDLLVEFQPGATPSLLTMAKIENELSPLLDGRKVDLRTAEDLSRYFRDEVVREAEVQYEA